MQKEHQYFFSRKINSLFLFLVSLFGQSVLKEKVNLNFEQLPQRKKKKKVKLISSCYLPKFGPAPSLSLLDLTIVYHLFLILLDTSYNVILVNY